ncbi:MAG: XdhC/CoxI family protein [Bacteroidales bacterium]|nr:XdhC/CoxI family protein [Bacteroidales bacterium]
MKNIYLQIAGTLPEKSGLVLATVTGTQGSTPQKPGSSALFESSALIAGTVGGGIVESEVQKFAGKCAVTKKSVYRTYNMDSDVTSGECPVCGGLISILIDAYPLSSRDVFGKMQDSLESGIPGVLITGITPVGDSEVTISRYWATGESDAFLPDQFKETIIQEVQGMLSARTGYQELNLRLPGEKVSTKFFLEPVFPLPRLVIAGAGHVGRALSHAGKLLDFEVIVIDDREEFANPHNLPDADHIILHDITESMREIRKDINTYIVIVTRGHSHDADALRQCIRSEAGYIGMMGSKSKVAKVHDDFIRNNWATEEEWQKVYTPVGLAIGSTTVEEIAVSIAAQLIQRRSANLKR